MEVIEIKYLLRKIDKTGDLQRHPGSGRPRLVRVPDNISTEEDLILSQGNDNTHVRARVYDWYFTLTCSKNDSGLKVFKTKRV